MATPNKKPTPAVLARQFITLAEPTGPTSNANPHRCDCFGGFCWRQLCHQKTYKGAPSDRFSQRVNEIAQSAPVRRLPKPKGQITVWRWDGSGEQVRVAEGRIPAHVTFDAKGHPVIK